MKRLVVLPLLVALLAGCNSGEVTGASVEDAMKERQAKAKALDEKEGKKGADSGLSYDRDQEPQ